MPFYRIISLYWLCIGASVVGVMACRSEAKPARSNALSVFAASSLTEAFEELEQRFEQEHRGVDVQLTFAGSQVLRLQLEQGAQADVFASANAEHMGALARAGVVAQSATFAQNELVVVVPKGNPAGINHFSELGHAQRLVLGTDNVPIGTYARAVFERATSRYGEEFKTEVYSHVVSEESNVRLLRAKVELGEADAAVVYRTDAAASDRVRMVPIPAELNVRASYPIGLLAHARQPDLARRFIAFVRGPAGQGILQAHGFMGVQP